LNRRSSRLPFESSSARRPEVFTDRSVGLDVVPSVFRDAGYVVHTIQEVFGSGPVPDVEWIQYTGERDMLAVCKDDRIRYNYLEWGLSCSIRGSIPAGERWFVAAEAEHGEGDQGVG